MPGKRAVPIAAPVATPPPLAPRSHAKFSATRPDSSPALDELTAFFTARSVVAIGMPTSAAPPSTSAAPSPSETTPLTIGSAT